MRNPGPLLCSGAVLSTRAIGREVAASLRMRQWIAGKIARDVRVTPALESEQRQRAVEAFIVDLCTRPKWFGAARR